MPSLRLLPLFALLFAVVVLVRLPAAWVVPALPASFDCESPTGTLWNGHCNTFRAGTLSLANLSWELLPGELLHAKLGVRARVQDPALQASGKALIGLQGRVQGYDLVARLGLPSPLAPGIPAGWSGVAELNVPRFVSQGTVLESAQGTLQLRDVRQARPAIEYGGFEWRVADTPLSEGQLRGVVRDLGGPLKLQGTLSVGLQGSFDLNVRVAAAPSAAEALEQSLQQLGAPDAQGYRSLLAAGTF